MALLLAAVGAALAALTGGGAAAALGTAIVAAALAAAGAPSAAPLAVAGFGVLLADLDPADTVLGFTAAFAAAHSYAAARHAGGWAVWVLVAVLLVLLELRAGPGGDEVPAFFMIVGPAVAGHALRRRDLVARELQERGAEIEAERDVYADLSVRYERARIAAEMHDIVAHAISVMVVQASAGQRLVAADRELAGEAFHAIAEAARQAESDMARLVLMLAAEEPEGDAEDLALVRELVARAAATGLDVRLRVDGDRTVLRGPARRSAYLVVREGLTNALRYASGAPVHVLVDTRAEELVVDVSNAAASGEGPGLAAHGSGNGLRGLREHLDTLGGRLEAGPTDDGGWRLRARVPRLAPRTALR